MGDVKLRLAREEDCDLLFKWVNDPDVRKNSFNNKEISYEEHVEWFYRKINSPSSCVFIAYNGKENPIGQIRVEIEDNIGIISYSISEPYRGRGYGTELLFKLPEKIKEKEVCVKILKGKVKKDNLPSRKAFLKAGYEEKDKGNYFEYIKKID
jgi:spore coat polysaccharide biosynthesis protein SpsF